MQTSAALASWCFHVKPVMGQFFCKEVMGERPFFAHVPPPVLEVSGLARRALRGPKAAESLLSKEDWLRLNYICWFATLIVGCGDASKDGRQQLKEIVSDVLHTRRVSCPSLKYLVRERMLRQL
jgi:hypothetical protein